MSLIFLAIVAVAAFHFVAIPLLNDHFGTEYVEKRTKMFLNGFARPLTLFAVRSSRAVLNYLEEAIEEEPKQIR